MPQLVRRCIHPGLNRVDRYDAADFGDQVTGVDNGVIAGGAGGDGRDVSATTLDRVVAGDAVVGVEVVVVQAAVEKVGSVAAGDRVLAGCAEQLVVAVVSVKPVVAGVAEEGVIAGVAGQAVVAVATDESISASPAREGVVTGAAIDCRGEAVRIGRAAGTGDRVVAEGGADDDLTDSGRGKGVAAEIRDNCYVAGYQDRPLRDGDLS